jgi:hypothetical protein
MMKQVCRGLWFVAMLLLTRVSHGAASNATSKSPWQRWLSRQSSPQSFQASSLKDALASFQESLESFHVHGWRWHTMSLIRESTRLQKLAKQASNQCLGETDLLSAVDYVVGFNMRGLHAIERDVFFPWVRSQFMTRLQKDASIEANKLTASLEGLLDDLERDVKSMEVIGQSMVSVAC